jgi:DNA polymerase V
MEGRGWMNDPVIIVIDLKAFYAFVECVDRGLDPLTTPLVVCDNERGPGTIVLSVSPYLKSMGVPSRCRSFELPKLENMIYAVPRMSLYLAKSAEVVSIFLDYVGEEDLHVYSIDESFLNVSPYLNLYKCTPKELAKRILDTVKTKTGLVCTAGIGPNIFMAKIALDKEAKNAPDRIAEWTMADVPTKLWTIQPLSEIWGISSHMEEKLNALGLKSVGDLANFSKDVLIQKFGIMGEQLHQHANGIDHSDIREKALPKDQSLSIGQTLMRDYDPKELPLIIREMTDDLALRLRLEKKLTSVVHLFVGYSGEGIGGFSHQCKLLRPTDDVDEIFGALLHIYEKYIQNHQIRHLGLSFGGLTYLTYEQIDLFVDPEIVDKKRRLQTTLDDIHARFGSNAVLRATALTKPSTAIERHSRIGGHRK